MSWSQNDANKYHEKQAQLYFTYPVAMECRLEVLPIGGKQKQTSAECIQVKLNKLNAGSMMDRIASLLRSIEAECMKRLRFHVSADVTADVVRKDPGAMPGTGSEATSLCPGRKWHILVQK